ncbi:MFS transporter [Tabrizicola sp. J26]|uniref:MFS transporter n=1 Tax=Alitabrizicola rongguiensis TaxID=2909234 RepID=UPI001F1FB9F9|nr:MFS transporter [Tabrizicola rongguiensis]MCF1710038.1 MFS transporter [Tabrizicola rongguiensis]
MTDSALPQTSDALARRNVVVLVAAQALLGTQLPMVFTIAGLAGTTLSPNPCWATLPITMMVMGSMLAATPLSLVMQRFGRRAGFVLGTFGGFAGGGLCSLALQHGSFLLFLAGSLLIGLYMSANGFYRFAATDLASAEFRPRAISWVMAGGLMSAIIGPQLVKLTSQAMLVPFLGTYLAVMGLNIVGVFLFALLHSPRPVARPQDAPKGRNWGELLADPYIRVAVICATVSYALMNLVMTSSPLAIVGCGFTTSNAADVVSSHVLAMYVPSFFTGALIARFGTERIMGLGLVILAGAGVVALMGVSLPHFFGAMMLLGIGWNFGFIGATTLLAAHHAPEERGRAQGMNDFIVFGGVTLASLSSGGLMNCSGGSPEAGWQMVNMAMLPFLILAGGALIWLVMRPR